MPYIILVLPCSSHDFVVLGGVFKSWHRLSQDLQANLTGAEGGTTPRAYAYHRGGALEAAFEACVEALKSVRLFHMAVATKYLVRTKFGTGTQFGRTLSLRLFAFVLVALVALVLFFALFIGCGVAACCTFRSLRW
jgi:hypothetical protein